ncbi:MAG: isoleucine--tRNA ligase, partial [Candidatus Portnoybacteria bacterium CG_4_8_14_3_um_filter_40_10]
MDLPQIEQKILKFWDKKKIFAKSLAKTKKGPRFIFFEGPPTANGQPGIHHVEARAFKDIILRFKTMQGFFVERKAGWDTHGLPVEIQVEKELGLKSKKDIEKYGIEKFNKKCKESVWRYKSEWEKMTTR